MTRIHRATLGVVVLCVLGNDDCGSSTPPTDPFTDADLRISQRLDIGRTYGEVVGKRVGYYIDAHKDFDAKPGDTYYCLDVRQTNTQGQATDTAYCGVRQVTYDAVEIGTKLPIERILNVYEIAQLNGRIVDLQVEAWKPAWYAVIDHATEMRVHRVDPQSFYRLEVGQQLPFTIPRGGATSTWHGSSPAPSPSSTTSSPTEEQAIP